MESIPLRARPSDWFFVVVFAAFAATSFLVDTIPLLGGGDVMRRALAGTYADCDPMFMHPPPFLFVAATTSGLVWGPLYVYFVHGFVRGRNRIRPFGLMYAGALTLAMLMIFAEELWSPVPGWASPRPGKFAAYNLPYLVVPILMGLRMRSPYPFGGDRPG
jgi:EXPERA (EXPanded EBP superfamily)